MLVVFIERDGVGRAWLSLKGMSIKVCSICLYEIEHCAVALDWLIDVFFDIFVKILFFLINNSLGRIRRFQLQEHALKNRFLFVLRMNVQQRLSARKIDDFYCNFWKIARTLFCPLITCPSLCPNKVMKTFVMSHFSLGLIFIFEKNNWHNFSLFLKKVKKKKQLWNIFPPVSHFV